METSVKEINISANQAGQRLDKLLAKYLDKAPKSFIYKMLRKKNITLNNKKAEGSEIIKLGDLIKLFLADETILKFSSNSNSPVIVKKSSISKPNITLDVIYEDENVIFVNKPSGILSQKAEITDISINEYIVDYLISEGRYTQEELKSFKPSICNRLDRNTSGLIAAGTSLSGLQFLNQMFRDREIEKYYITFVRGYVESGAHIKGYLIKNERTNKVSITRERKGKDDEYIETNYEPLFSSDEVSILKVELITGKPHQIRAHLASIGHPVVGDMKYGDKSLNEAYAVRYGIKSQMLHSYELIFPELSGDMKYLSGKIFKAKLPNDFIKCMEALHVNMEF